MEAAFKNPPGSAVEVTYVSEVRLESSATTVSFSEPCPVCGNRKRRCLLPPTRSRKKVLVVEPSCPLNLESAAKAFRYPPPTVAPPISHPSPDPVPPISPPSFLVPAPSVQLVAKKGLANNDACGNRKRLLPLARSQKQLFVSEAASALSPSSSPTRPVLIRPESSQLPSCSRSAGLSLKPSQPPHSSFLRSHPFPSGPFGRTVDTAFIRTLESAAEAFHSPPPTVAPPILHPSPNPAPDRCLERSTPLATVLANKNKEDPNADGGKYTVEWLNGAMKVSVDCLCGALHQLEILER